MSRDGKKQPPKKKHATKPRSVPVAPLSDDERQSLAMQEFAKAGIHLAEAETLAKLATAPNACAHAAYYAMYHCAAATILAAGGVGKRKSFPASHTHVLEHFGKLVDNQPGFLGEAGRILGQAQTFRATADYGLVQTVSLREAGELATEARRFVDACASKWRLA